MITWSADLIRSRITSQAKLDILKELYRSETDMDKVIARLTRIADGMEGKSLSFVSAPGRTELGGNHTDHNHGKVLCAAVEQDTLAVVVPRDNGQVCVKSEGFEDRFEMNIADLESRPTEMGTSMALIRGVLAGLQKAGARLGGFTAQVTSNVAVGSGLSSSASFEVLIGCIINDLYNRGEIAPEEIARIGQFAENTYFDKPCGLMDQMASAVGGVISIDFMNPAVPVIQKHEFDFVHTGYSLVVVNTGGNHADLIEAYASIPAEMRQVAHYFGADVLRTVTCKDLYDKLPELHEELGDRSVLRALHFMEENKRVDRMAAALESGDFEVYLDQVRASGLSSQNILQNTVPPASNGSKQGVAMALGLSQLFFDEKGRGVSRVHGGGFAGTIQAYVHTEDLAGYKALMESVFGIGSVEPLAVRARGSGIFLRLTE